MYVLFWDTEYNDYNHVYDFVLATASTLLEAINKAIDYIEAGEHNWIHIYAANNAACTFLYVGEFIGQRLTDDIGIYHGWYIEEL